MYYEVQCFWLVLVVLCTTVFLFVKVFWCPCMAINVSAQYNSRPLPDIMTRCDYIGEAI